MTEQIELSDIDLRYQSYRLRSETQELQLLHSMIKHGIREPLQGVATEEGSKILLNGFKRFRCADKLNIKTVPWYSLGEDEAAGILELLRCSTARNLTILEQAGLIDELLGVYKMTNADIAVVLEKSRAWVSVRSGIIGEMSEYVKSEIFNGRFPAYAYLYVLRPFIRINGVTTDDVDAFVSAVSGKNMSIRDLRLLAQGYFKGSAELRSQIRNGNTEWSLKQLTQKPKPATGCSADEQRLLSDLERLLVVMRRVTVVSYDQRLGSRGFYAQVNLLTREILDYRQSFEETIRGLYDRSGQAAGNLLST